MSTSKGAIKNVWRHEQHHRREEEEEEENPTPLAMISNKAKLNLTSVEEKEHVVSAIGYHKPATNRHTHLHQHSSSIAHVTTAGPPKSRYTAAGYCCTTATISFIKKQELRYK